MEIMTTTVEPFNSSQVGQVHFRNSSRVCLRRSCDKLQQVALATKARPKTAADHGRPRLSDFACQIHSQFYNLAEREGFEPPWRVKPKRFSRPPR